MSGADITAVIHAIFVAAPEQSCTRPSLVGKQQGAAFLAALPAPWTTLLAPRASRARPRPRLPLRRRTPPKPRLLLLPWRTTSPLPRPRSSPLGP